MKLKLWIIFPMRRMCLLCPIMKKESIMWIHVYTYWKRNFDSKNGKRRSFFYETKASISFIPMRRMCLWWPTIKRKEIIMWIHVYPIERRTLIIKMIEREVCPMKPKHQYHLSNKEIIMWIRVYPNWKRNFNSKNGQKRSISYETNVSIHLS